MLLLLLLAGSAAGEPPLKAFYNPSQQDNLVGATAATFAFAHDNGFLSTNTPPHTANDGLIASNTTAPAGGASLQHWYSAARKDSFTFASASALASAKEANYTFVRMEGYVHPKATGAAQTPLRLYWSAGRNDHFLVAANSQHEKDALQGGYRLVSTEGFVVGTPPPPPPPPPQWMEWPSQVPTGNDGGGSSPFKPSPDLSGFEYWSGGANIVAGTGSDTWYPSWSANGDLYTTWTDGGVTDSATKQHISSSSCGPCRKNNGSDITQGFARVAPSKPSSPTESGVTGVVDVATFDCSALPYQGRYPSGNLYYKGVWYYGTYSLAELNGNAQYPCGNWCVQGPFVGFRHSLNKGKNWTEPRMEMARDFSSYKASDNLFGELGPICEGEINATFPGSSSQWTCTGRWKGKVKFGAPHVVDLGQELEHSPDSDGVKRAYMVGHGASQEYQPQSWMHGSQVYMSRTKTEVSVETMSDGAHWEYFAGYKSNGNTPVWKDDVADAAPLFTWENRTGVVTMTYMPAIKKYIMCVSTCTWANGSKSTVGPFDTYFLESDAITGPFTMVSYLAQFGPEAYFVNIPSSMLDSEGGGFLSYSANFAFHQGHKPVNSQYTWDLLPFKFTKKSVTAPTAPTTTMSVGAQ